MNKMQKRNYWASIILISSLFWFHGQYPVYPASPTFFQENYLHITELASNGELLTVRGKVRGKWDKILLRVRKGSQQWNKWVYPEDGMFATEIPLLFGKGEYEIEWMLPMEQDQQKYRVVTSHIIQGDFAKRWFPIQYFAESEKVGLEILRPLGGETVSGSKYPLELMLHQKSDDFPSHLAVSVEKGEDRSLYYFPIKKEKMEGQLWLRFGEGEYRIRILRPQWSDSIQRWQLVLLAEWTLISTHNQDQRDLLPQQGIESDHPEIYRLSRQLTAEATTTKQKALQIYRYVATTIHFDLAKYYREGTPWEDSALATLRNRKGICRDYSYLTIALLRASNIPARLIEGTAAGEAHAWVEAEIDGKWITIDPTWGAGYLTPWGTFSQEYRADFFQPSEELFQQHQKNREVY